MASGIAVVSDNGAPDITIDSIIPASCGGTGAIYVSVSGTSGSESYAWNNGATSQDLIGYAPGIYTLTVEDGGCSAVISAEIPAITPQEQPICIVTVDSATGANLIVWEKVQTSGIDHYNIYRETSVPNQFTLIGTRPADSLSVYVDSMAYPWIRSYRYKISAVDNCGNESALSDIHKTIHVNLNVGYIQNTVNLIWDDYEGFQYNSFHVWRYDAGTGWNEVVGSPLPNTLHSITADVFTNTLMYAVTVDKPGTPCLANKANGGPFAQSVSNIDDYSTNTSTETNNFANEVSLYPNPNNGSFVVAGKTINRIAVYNMNGQKLLETTAITTRTTIQLPAHSKGVYFVIIYGHDFVKVRKIVIM
jgi:hypothetical protein